MGSPHTDRLLCPTPGNLLAAKRIEWGKSANGKAGRSMQIVVFKSPKCLRGILRILFGIQKEN
jgi:hypothetical protein